MKIVKRSLTLLFSAAFFVSCFALPASALTERMFANLRSSYTDNHISGVTLQYDVGSIMPYDDVRGRTKIKSTGGSGYAEVSITGANGNTAFADDYSADSSGWYDTMWATVASTDTAMSLVHAGNSGSESYIINVVRVD